MVRDEKYNYCVKFSEVSLPLLAKIFHSNFVLTLTCVLWYVSDALVLRMEISGSDIEMEDLQNPPEKKNPPRNSGKFHVY